MSARNKALLQAIKAMSQLPENARKKASEHLDSIIAIDLTSKQVLEHFCARFKADAAYWQVHGVEPQKADELNEQFLDSNDLAALHQAAAEQRVFWGLQQASAEVLTGVLTHNAAECSAYIADKLLNKKDLAPLSEDSVKEIQRYVAVGTLKKEESVNLSLLSRVTSKDDVSVELPFVTDDNISMLQSVAREILFAERLQAITNNKNVSQQHPHLLQAYSALSEETKNRLLELPEETCWQLMQSTEKEQLKRLLDSPVNEALIDKIIAENQRVNQLNRINNSVLAAMLIEQGFTLTKEQVAQVNQLLVTHKQLNDEFLTGFDQIYKNADALRLIKAHQSAMNAVQAENNKRFDSLSPVSLDVDKKILEVFSRLDPQPITAAELKAMREAAATSANITEFIKDIPPDISAVAQIRAKLSEEDFFQIKQSAKDGLAQLQRERLAANVLDIKKEINQCGDSAQLAAIEKASDFVEFKSQLQKINSDMDLALISKEHMLELQSQARAVLAVRALGLRYNGVSAHQQILSAYVTLPVERQRFLLDPKNSAIMRQLMRASDSQKALLKHHLGQDATVIDAIVKENERVARLSTINNAALARYFVDTPSAQVSDIATLNIELSKITKKEELASLLHLYMVPEEAHASIWDQHMFIRPMMSMYAAGDTVSQRVLDVFLRMKVESDTQYQGSFTLQDRENLKKLWVKSSDVTSFIKNVDASLLKDQTKIQDFRLKLANELSTEEFEQVKDRIICEKLSEPNGILSVPQYLGDIRDGFKEITESVAPFISNNDTLAKIKDDFFGPAFDAQVKKNPVAMSAEYSQLVKQNTLVLDDLLKNQKQLAHYLSRLPENSTHKEINELRKKLQKEKEAVDKAISAYNEAQTRLIKILRAIDEVTNRKNYVYQSDKLRCTAMTAEDIGKLKAKPAGTAPIVAALGAPASADKQVQLGANDVGYVYESTRSKKPYSFVVKPQGATEESYTIYSEEKGVQRHASCRVEAIEPPNDVAGYMDMALALITANGGKPPSKDNPIRLSGGDDKQMALFWTALMILGKEKFGFGAEAIRMLDGTFDPNKKEGFLSSSEGAKYYEHFRKLESHEINTRLHDAGTLMQSSKKDSQEADKTREIVEDYRASMQAGRKQQQLEGIEKRRDAGEVYQAEDHTIGRPNRS